MTKHVESVNMCTVIEVITTIEEGENMNENNIYDGIYYPYFSEQAHGYDLIIREWPRWFERPVWGYYFSDDWTTCREVIV